MFNKNLSKFQRRSLQLFSSSILLTAGLAGLTHQLFRHRPNPPTGPLAWLIAIVPALPFLGTIYLCLRFVAREKDEFIRAQILLALLEGAFLTLAATVIYTFLQNYLEIPAPPAMAYVDIFLIAAMVALRIHLRNSQ